jgi:hypothetical protein
MGAMVQRPRDAIKRGMPARRPYEPWSFATLGLRPGRSADTLGAYGRHSAPALNLPRRDAMTTTTTQDIANDFVALLKEGKDHEAAAKYNADSIASHEADGPMLLCEGKDAVKKKGEWWVANHEVHSASVEGPYVNGDQFAVRLAYDVTPKMTGQRMQMDEVGLYTVRDGKIVSERFLYGKM